MHVVFSLAARCHSVPALSYVSRNTFLDIINSENCKRNQTERLHAAEDKSIVTFSINTEAAIIFRVGNVPVTQIYGFISTEKQMWDNVVQDWLRHLDTFNLELTAISNRHNHEKIEDFLDDSRLWDESG